MNFLDDLQNDFIRQFRTIPSVTASVLDLTTYLEASQYELIQLMVANGIWQGPVPPDPGGEGTMELGLVPYWIKNPPPFISVYIDSNPILKGVWTILTLLIPDKFSTGNYNALITAARTKGVVADDGTIFGESTYEQLDPHWMWAYVNYLVVKYADDRATFHTLPPAQVTPITLTGATAGEVKIAIVGDWGTGFYESGSAAQDVIDQIMAMTPKPDYLIHLGDVYYAGTADLFFPLNEEQDNFLNVWPAAELQPAGTSFTLNSNHEMYGGAKGYYKAVADARFAQQKNLSYFALQYGGWTLLGLDSAFFTTSHFYMQGSIGGNSGIQTAWMQSLGLAPDKTIVMTHHTGLSANGADENSLICNEVKFALGDDPAAWYWGHIHNAIVYKSPTRTGRNTLSRCVGHGAIPFGDGWGIPGPYVDYYAHTPDASRPGSHRVLNGFATLTISDSGSITEEFFEVGDNTAKYSNTY
jgi:hypothetical protein